MRAKVKEVLAVVLGTAIMAASLDLFLVPAELAPGGISGLAIVVNHLTGVTPGVLIFAFNIPIFIWGLRHFSKGFMIFSLVGMILLSIFTDALSVLPQITDDILLSALYGGLLLGIGIGIVFTSGCTTGGTDIAAQILKKKFPFVSVGRFVLIIDVFVVGVAGLVFGKWEVILYSAVSLYISTLIIDLIVEGGSSAKIAYVISERQREMAESISSKLERGTTVLHGSSFYSGSEKTVLLCVVGRYELARLKSIIREVDSEAFVIFSDAREVLGKGFGSY